MCGCEDRRAHARAKRTNLRSTASKMLEIGFQPILEKRIHRTHRKGERAGWGTWGAWGAREEREERAAAASPHSHLTSLHAPRAGPQVRHHHEDDHDDTDDITRQCSSPPPKRLLPRLHRAYVREDVPQRLARGHQRVVQQQLQQRPSKLSDREMHLHRRWGAVTGAVTEAATGWSVTGSEPWWHAARTEPHSQATSPQSPVPRQLQPWLLGLFLFWVPVDGGVDDHHPLLFRLP